MIIIIVRIIIVLVFFILDFSSYINKIIRETLLCHHQASLSMRNPMQSYKLQKQPESQESSRKTFENSSSWILILQK